MLGQDHKKLRLQAVTHLLTRLLRGGIILCLCEVESEDGMGTTTFVVHLGFCRVANLNATNITATGAEGKMVSRGTRVDANGATRKRSAMLQLR